MVFGLSPKDDANVVPLNEIGQGKKEDVEEKEAVAPSPLSMSVMALEEQSLASFRVQDVANKIFKNPFALIALSMISAPFTGLGALFASTGFFLFNRKKIIFVITLQYTIKMVERMQWNWWSRFDNNPDPNVFKVPNLLLGAIPLEDKDHHLELQQLGVTAVVTLLEKEEREYSGLSLRPVSQATWENLNIKRATIDAIDFLPLSQEQINDAVKYIEDYISAGDVVYVHCKAGVGRSATAVICYLLKNYPQEFPTVRSALEYVKMFREQINLRESQMEAIHNYYRFLHPDEG